MEQVSDATQVLPTCERSAASADNSYQFANISDRRPVLEGRAILRPVLRVVAKHLLTSRRQCFRGLAPHCLINLPHLRQQFGNPCLGVTRNIALGFIGPATIHSLDVYKL